MTTQQTFSTAPTQYYLNAITAQEAGGPSISFSTGILVVGDGNGVVPAISTLIAANGVTHEVWRGEVITSVAVDANIPNQLDITAEIPASIGGVEIGPFTITEIALLNSLGNTCIVATTNVQKTTSGQGQTTDLIISVGVGFGVGSVTLQPPSGNFVTMSQVVSAYNSNLPTCVSPLTKTDITESSGWIDRTFAIQPGATPSSDPPTSATEPPALGYGRPATANEFAQGAVVSGRYQTPWVTPQQAAALLRPPPSTTFYIASGGSDSNPGTSAAPFATIQGAFNALSAKYFASLINLVINQSGTYSGAIFTASAIQQWNLSTASGVSAVISATSTAVNSGRGVRAWGAVNVSISGNISFATYYENFEGHYGATLTANGVGLALTANGFAMSAANAANVVLIGANSCSGSGLGLALGYAGFVAFGSTDSVTNNSCSVAFTGTPNFSAASVVADYGGLVHVFPSLFSFTGATTGPQWAADYGGGVLTDGAGAGILPGSTAGAGLNNGYLA